MSSQKTATVRPQSALDRLQQLKRALQKRLRRKPTTYEKTALDHTALLMVRAEMASGDPTADSNTIVRLHNCSRRALRDFEAITGLDAPKRKAARSMADIEAELRHV